MIKLINKKLKNLLLFTLLIFVHSLTFAQVYEYDYQNDLTDEYEEVSNEEQNNSQETTEVQEETPIEKEIFKDNKKYKTQIIDSNDATFISRTNSYHAFFTSLGTTILTDYFTAGLKLSAEYNYGFKNTPIYTGFGINGTLNFPQFNYPYTYKIEGDKMLKPIEPGSENFTEYINNNLFYIDKTSFIKTVFKPGQGKVLLITRPRRFGKTLTMSTFYEFLRINPKDPNNADDTSYQEALFKDTKIFKDKEFCSEYMGKFPVIFITLKSVEGPTFEEAFNQLGYIIYDLLSQFTYLISSEKLSNNDKERVASFNEPLKVQYIYKGGKPLTKGYKKAMELMGTDVSNTLFVGDQIFTDIWGAKSTGLYSILLDPINPKEEIQIVLKRYLERVVLHFYKGEKKKGI